MVSKVLGHSQETTELGHEARTGLPPKPGVFLFYHKATHGSPGRSKASGLEMFPKRGFGLGPTEGAAVKVQKSEKHIKVGQLGR